MEILQSWTKPSICNDSWLDEFGSFLWINATHRKFISQNFAFVIFICMMAFFSRQDDILFFLTRTTKLSLLRSRIRRQLMQLRQAQRRNMSARRNELHLLQALLASVKGSPQATVKVLQESASPRQPAATGVQSRTGLVKQPCSFTSDKEPPCSASALPYTNHCIKRILVKLLT